jgi:CRISPR-associated protein Csb2
MPLVISQLHPLGRYHATRWNQNPFEDRFGEWPPSPWRMLRALAARWFQYQRETGVQNAALRDELLCTLAAEVPSFWLPPMSWHGQSLRQYLPTALKLQYKYRKNPTTKQKELDYSYRAVTRTLSLDTYRTLPETEPLLWVWPSCDLSPDLRKLLGELLRRMHYFGRTESFARMRIVEGDFTHVPNCILGEERSPTSVPVLVARPEVDIAILLASTDDKQVANRRIPPGTAWYFAEVPVPVQHPPHSPHRSRHESRIQVVRYALDSTVLPLVTETLPVAEAARRQLMGIYGRRNPAADGQNGRSPVFSGKNEHGVALTGHGHAYYLPTDEDGDGRLDHLTVFARDGFGPAERIAMDRFQALRTGRKGEENHPLRLLLIGMGTLGEYSPGPLRRSKVWVSATPYVAARHAKTRGRSKVDLFSLEARTAFLIADLRAQIRDVLPGVTVEQLHIEPIQDANGIFKVTDRWSPIQFKRFRRKASDDGGRRLAGAFRLIFPAELQGPIALGHSCHFGLGLFAAEE